MTCIQIIVHYIHSNKCLHNINVAAKSSMKPTYKVSTYLLHIKVSDKNQMSPNNHTEQ